MDQPEKPELKGPALLMDGPFADHERTGIYDSFFEQIGKGVLRIPLDGDLDVTMDDDPFAYAIYYTAGIPAPFSVFSFAKFRRPDGRPFPVIFLGGPFAGERQLPEPAKAMVRAAVPLPSKPNPEGGR